MDFWPRRMAAEYGQIKKFKCSNNRSFAMAIQAIQILAVLGFVISLYALRVKFRIDNDKDYKPLCDISKKISCTKSFGSTYGSLAGLPNPVSGLVFYAVILFLASYGNITLIFYLSIVAVLVTLYLAYASYFILRSYCVVCTSIYVINILLLYFSYLIV